MPTERRTDPHGSGLQRVGTERACTRGSEHVFGHVASLCEDGGGGARTASRSLTPSEGGALCSAPESACCTPRFGLTFAAQGPGDHARGFLASSVLFQRKAPARTRSPRSGLWRVRRRPFPSIPSPDLSPPNSSSPRCFWFCPRHHSPAPRLEVGVLWAAPKWGEADRPVF